ncbi:Putative steroid dehydrogenase [Mycobacteroides abscessus subsp. abscessus]|nr:Putative steroid dehydrogenase [Mycobacteroides abscessus subsp. abscessus]
MTRRTLARPNTASRSAADSGSSFALLTWALPGVVILLITAGNLIPRALATHRWYQEKFVDYPADRKALILAIRQVPGKRSTFNVSVVVMGMLVTSMHGYLNGTLFSHDFFGQYSDAWLHDPRFLLGLVVYLCGFTLLLSSESIVRNLRDKKNPGAAEYRIPFGGGFRFVTSPAYLGELIAWSGFALLTWALPGVVILLITAGNLIPRALATHRWYQEKFIDYPADRKALIPKII